MRGAVREGRLSHAFLFCGPRGTGKTSTARILAKMVNCERGPTAEPCGVCEQCVAIREGSHLDVVEIDAASHGGVDDARELRERAPTAPAMGREKVYIIDEAQRLSREAFDALLQRTGTEIRPAVYHQSGWLAAGVGIDDGDFFHVPRLDSSGRAVLLERRAPDD